MAHKKGVGSSKNGRESHSKRLGVKIYIKLQLLETLSQDKEVIQKTQSRRKRLH
jgi:hypothetical protein